jgi:protein ImuB
MAMHVEPGLARLRAVSLPAAAHAETPLHVPWHLSSPTPVPDTTHAPAPVRPEPVFVCLRRARSAAAHDAPAGNGGPSEVTGGGSAAGEAVCALADLAGDYSPRVETLTPDLVVFDGSGVRRLFGGRHALAQQVHGAMLRRGWRGAVGIASTRTAAMAVALSADGMHVVARGREAVVLAPLTVGMLPSLDRGSEPPVRLDARARVPGARHHFRLAPVPVEGVLPAAHASAPEAEAFVATLIRWGITSLGQFARLPAADVLSRVGAIGPRWQRLARGEDLRPLVRDERDEPYEGTHVLEWPVEGLEPLSFVVARVIDPLCARLEQGDRGAVAVHTMLRLVTRDVHTRQVQVPSPMRDPKVLRTLVMLDLEAHPPPAGIDAVTVTFEPAPYRRAQHSLLVKPLPPPDAIATITARLTALMGEGKVGSPQVIDSHRPGAMRMVPFTPEHPAAPVPVPMPSAAASPLAAAIRTVPIDGADRRVAPVGTLLRRFRRPAAARVRVDAAGRPTHVSAPLAGVRGGGVTRWAGPWKTSGEWWRVETPRGQAGMPGWDRDEWDVALDDQVVYRVMRDRASDRWFVEGYWD